MYAAVQFFKNTVITISELQNYSVSVLFFHMEKKILLKIIWWLDKNSIAIFLEPLCRIFMIQKTQEKPQFNRFEKVFQLAWSHQPGEWWWQSQCRRKEAVSLHNSYPSCYLGRNHLCSSPHLQLDLILKVLPELLTTVSWMSKPEFWTRTLGIISNASANAWTPSWALPFTLGLYLIKPSPLPPPLPQHLELHSHHQLYF